MRSVCHGLAVGIAITLACSQACAEDPSSAATEPLVSQTYSGYLKFAQLDSQIRTALEAQVGAWRSNVAELSRELSSRLRGSEPAEIERMATERSKQFLARYSSAQIAAERRSIKFEDFEGGLREQAKMNFLIENTIGKGIKAEKRQIEESAATLSSQPSTVQFLLLEQLIFPIAPDEASVKLEMIRAAADKAFQELSKPSGSFSNLATEYATSPYFARYQKLPVLASDELTPELARALSKAPDGAISPPIRSSYGIHLVRVIQRFTAEPVASEADIAEEALALRLREHIARTLKELSQRP